MKISFVQAVQWVGAAMGIALMVGLNFDYESDADETVNAPVEDSLSQSLLGYWKMDEGTGTSTTADSSGNSNNLTMTNADAEDWQAGQIGGYSLDFNGTDEWLTVADPSSGILDFADVRDFSISGWFNRDTADTLDTVVAKRDGDTGSDTGYMIWLGTDDFLNFEISDGTDQYAVASSSTYATTGWHQFVATWKDSLGMALFVDGASVGSNTASTSSIGSLANAVAFRIGAESSTGTENPFDGKIDDVKLYSHALSANEVSRLYQTTVPGSPVDTGLVGHWTFDGNDVNWGDTSSEIKDVSGKGNHGAVSGLTRSSVAIGKLGQGLSFNGTSDYVDLSDPASGVFDFNNADFSISGWFYRNSSGRNDPIVSKKILDPGYVGYMVYLRNDDYLFLIMTDATAYQCSIRTSVEKYTVPGWHHFAWTIDENSGVKVYVDGEEKPTYSPQTFSTLGDLSNDRPLRIGAYSTGYQTGYFNGKIDDVRIYNRTLSETEVANLYNLGR